MVLQNVRAFFSCVFLIFIFSTEGWAGYLEDFEAIKNNARNLEDKGAICEEVALYKLQQLYPDSFAVSGIAYSDKNGSIGELDVILFDKSSKKAFMIAEVKCWKDAKEGLRKARDQRSRFFDVLGSTKEIHFHYHRDRSLSFTKQNFRGVENFISIGQKGTKANGYDLELDYTLDELMKMRTEIMRCQYQGACAQP